MSDDISIEILLVEDDPGDIRLALHALRAENLGNHNIEIVRDGEEALDFLFCRGAYANRIVSNRPKLILLDLKLPKIDGLEVLGALKSDVRTRAIPVTVLTSSKEERDIVESYRLGVNSYIQKPVDFDQFCDTMKSLGMYWMIVNQPPPSRAFMEE